MKTVKGMNDLYGDNLCKFNYFKDTATTILSNLGYTEVITPVLEHTELFTRSIGTETEIVGKEMFSFNLYNRDYSLRPESTASIARAYIEHGWEFDTTMQQVYYLQPMYRYERPQHGRQREFYQLGTEMFGESAYIDAFSINNLVTIFNTLNIPVTLKINSIGNKEDRGNYIAKLVDYLSKYELPELVQHQLNTNPLRILDSKDKQVQKLLTEAPIINYSLCRESAQYINKVLDNISVPFTIDPKLVRGLDYYNDTVFELVSTDYTLAGGGRYDNLLSDLSNHKVNKGAFGWAIGVERVLDYISTRSRTLDHYVVCETEEDLTYFLTQLHRYKSFNIKIDFSLSNLNKQIARGKKLGAETIIKVSNKQEQEICLSN
jgi:histidyl-tRNA synthetase